MPRVEQNGMPTSLHYALTDSQCSKCGKQLEWNANFDDINQPKYTSQHCNQDYAIHIDTVKVQMMTPRGGGRKAAKGSLEDEPRAIKMAKGLEEEHKKKKEETAPSMKPEERLDLEDYKSKYRVFINIGYRKNNRFYFGYYCSDTRRRCASRNRTRNSYRRQQRKY